MLIKIFVLLVFVGILASLASALFYLAKDSGDSKRMVKALSWRIGLSLGLFLILMLLSLLGVIQPHGLAPPAG